MKTVNWHKAAAALLGFACVAAVTPAWAGAGVVISIDYAPVGAGAVSAVPSLSQWGLIAMALLVAVMGYRSMRGRVGEKALKSVVLAGLLGFAAMHFDGWLNSASAVPVPIPEPTNLPNAAGGSVEIINPAQNQDYPVVNTSGVALKIVSISVVPASIEFLATETAPRCLLNLPLAPGATCSVRIGAPD